MNNKSPKKYECLDCGFKSSRSKTLTVGPIGFARCFKCKGRVKEREEWLEFYNKALDEQKNLRVSLVANISPKANESLT